MTWSRYVVAFLQLARFDFDFSFNTRFIDFLLIIYKLQTSRNDFLLKKKLELNIDIVVFEKNSRNNLKKRNNVFESYDKFFFAK